MRVLLVVLSEYVFTVVVAVGGTYDYVYMLAIGAAAGEILP